MAVAISTPGAYTTDPITEWVVSLLKPHDLRVVLDGYVLPVLELDHDVYTIIEYVIRRYEHRHAHSCIPDEYHIAGE